MGKCQRCGRRGLFFKVGPDGICENCRIEQQTEKKIAQLNSEIAELEKKRADSYGLMREALATARAEAERQVSSEYGERMQKNAELRDQQARLESENAAAEKALKSATRKAESFREFVKSVQYAYHNWMGDEPARAAKNFADMPLAELLPEPDLQCLTIKQLKSRYNALRKQIISLCEDYESQYKTKANATLYRLMVLALEAEIENILYSMQYGKLETAVASVRELTSKYYQIVSQGNQSIAGTLKRFIGQIESMYLDVVSTEYEYYVQRERAREEQRALKEQMRQEAEERKRLEQERKKVEAEEQKYRQEIERITEQMQQAHDAELETLRKRLAEMTEMIGQVEEKKAEIINLQNGKAGTVYIISNIGSFGDDVFKIGMTRRLEPQERVNELGDASVPFPFDVHSFIFSEDAVALESALHKELNNRRVNKVNLRKEFFHVSADELQNIVERIDPTAPFRTTALAEQYRQSQSVEVVPDEVELEDIMRI
ncbi:MAG: GIY-YIG nuclease family protein [Christensenellales bacterium]